MNLVWSAITYFFDISSTVTHAIKQTFQVIAISIESFIRHHHEKRVSKDASYVSCLWTWVCNVFSTGKELVKALFCMQRRCGVCHCLGHNKQNCPSQEFGSGWVAFHEQFVPHPAVTEQVDQVVDEFTTKYRPAVEIDSEKLFSADADIGFRDRWSIEARGGGLSGFVEDLQGNVGKIKDAVGLDSIDFSDLAG
jgi:hypothetical protein